MAEVIFTITGLEDGNATLKRLRDGIRPAALRSLVKSAEEVMSISKEDYCPVDTGALRGSGAVEIDANNMSFASVRLGYGGPAAPYAIYVHEMNRNYHNGKQWKYLETPLKTESAHIMKKLADDVEKFVESRGGEGYITLVL